MNDKMINIQRNIDRQLKHDNGKCLGCGICVGVCPTSAINLGPILPIARGLLEIDNINIIADKCALCGICASSCPFGALKFQLEGKEISQMESYPHWTHATNINEGYCIYCQACQNTCPQDAITVTRTLPTRKNLVSGEIEVDTDECVYCGICEEICPTDAIKVSQADSKNKKVDVDLDKCVYCLVCKKACPTKAIKAVCRVYSYGDRDIDPADTITTGNVILNFDQCVSCGWCQEVCPVDAVQVIKPFEGEITKEVSKDCKGATCHACQDVCPCNAIKIVDGEIKINKNVCVLCGACSKACPQNTINVIRSSMKLENLRSKSWKKH